MSNEIIDCYILPAEPLPLLLPTECIADVVDNPTIEPLENVSAVWMTGHATWNNQRLSVISYNALLDPAIDDSSKSKAHLVVLNPIPGAIRKAYTGIVCYGDVMKVKIQQDVDMAEVPEGIDKRYVEAALRALDQNVLVPRLTALAVAFSYF